jgi:hypothetical protein
MNRECGSCTKCCEGNLDGVARGIFFHKGKPCHFVEIGKGCSIYEDRPKPCISYKCSWLTDDRIPVWMKPSEVNSIIDERFIEGIPYLSLKEAGETLQPRVLSWFILFGLKNKINIWWMLEGGENWIGSPDFSAAFEKANVYR